MVLVDIAMPVVQVDRAELASSLFSHAYYTCLPFSHRVWQDVGEALYNCVEYEIEPVALQKQILSAVSVHAGSKAPVSLFHKNEAYSWFRTLAIELDWPLLHDFQELRVRSGSSQYEP